jgi:hypothetical protein
MSGPAAACSRLHRFITAGAAHHRRPPPAAPPPEAGWASCMQRHGSRMVAIEGAQSLCHAGLLGSTTLPKEHFRPAALPLPKDSDKDPAGQVVCCHSKVLAAAHCTQTALRSSHNNNLLAADFHVIRCAIYDSKMAGKFNWLLGGRGWKGGRAAAGMPLCT